MTIGTIRHLDIGLLSCGVIAASLVSSLGPQDGRSSWGICEGLHILVGTCAVGKPQDQREEGSPRFKTKSC